MADIPSICRVRHVTSCTLLDTVFSWPVVVTGSRVWKPVRLKTGRIVMWSVVFSKVMKWCTAGAVMKQRESEIFTLQRAGSYVKVRCCQIREAGGKHELKRTVRY